MARKKQGRNKDWCKSYRASGTKEKNRAARLRREVRKQPTNFQVISALESVDAKAGKEARARGEKIVKEQLALRNASVPEKAQKKELDSIC